MCSSNTGGLSTGPGLASGRGFFSSGTVPAIQTAINNSQKARNERVASGDIGGLSTGPGLASGRGFFSSGTVPALQDLIDDQSAERGGRPKPGGLGGIRNRGKGVAVNVPGSKGLQNRGAARAGGTILTGPRGTSSAAGNPTKTILGG